MAIYRGPDIITDGLVFCMDFANSKCYPGSGTSCFDLANSANIGELVNSPTFTTSVNNKFFTFNGTTNSRVIRIPNNTTLDTQTPSVEVWFRTASLNQNGFFFEKGTVNTQYSLFQEGVTIRWRRMVPSFSSTSIIGSNYMVINRWYQMVATYTSGSAKIYINGSLAINDNVSGTISTNSGGMSIGAYGGYAGARDYYYNGDIAITRVYNKELSSNEILYNYNATKGRFGL